MNNFKKIFAIFLVLPFLMANSAAPYGRPTSYTSFEATPLTLSSDERNYKIYSSTITNTGEGFIDLDSMHCSSQSSYVYPATSFYEEVLAPGKSLTVEFYSTKTINTNDYEFVANAYQEFVGDPITNITISESRKSGSINYDENNNPSYLYTYYLYFSNDFIPEEDYSVIFEVEFLNETHYFYDYYFSTYLTITSTEDVNVEDIQIKSARLIEFNTKEKSFSSDLLFVLFIFGYLLFSSIPLLILAGIIVAIIFIVRAIKNSKKNKKDEKDNKAKDSSKVKTVAKNRKTKSK